MSESSMKSGELVAGKYRLDARLGIGGMGEVWRAIHTGTGSAFALKFMHAHASASKSARTRFAREARVSARINHPNVIDIFDVGEIDDGILYLAMELLEGVSLADALHTPRRLTVQDFLTVMLDTAGALAAAHSVGVVHRDIKPGNIFLHEDEATGFASAKILDFGISKLNGIDDSHHTKTGAVLGSPRYMSPEQTRSAAGVDHRTDLWSFGVILYEGLTGTWPHQGDSFSSLVVAICTTPPASIDETAPHLPEPLRAVVRGCLQPIQARIQDAEDLAARIGAVLRDPSLLHLTLPRPQHPPSEVLKAVDGLRIRPLLLTTTSGITIPTSSSPDSLSTTRQRVPQPPTEPVPEYLEDDGSEATRIRPLAPLDRSSYSVLDSAVTPPIKRPASPGVNALIKASAAPVTPTSSPFDPPPSPGLPPPREPAPLRAAAPQETTPLPSSLQSSLDGPAFKAHVKTIPMQAAAILRAELERVGALQGRASDVAQATPLPHSAPTPPPYASFARPALPPGAATDPLVHTVSRMSFDARPSTFPDPQATAPPATPLPSPPSPPSPPFEGQPTRMGKGLGLIAAVLSVLLVGIMVSLVSVLRSALPSSAAAGSALPASPPPSASASHPSVSASTEPLPPPEPSPSASATAASTVETPPAASASASASASAPAAPSAPVTAAPLPDRPRGGRSKAPSKMQRLGSGL